MLNTQIFSYPFQTTAQLLIKVGHVCGCGLGLIMTYCHKKKITKLNCVAAAHILFRQQGLIQKPTRSADRESAFLGTTIMNKRIGHHCAAVV